MTADPLKRMYHIGKEVLGEGSDGRVVLGVVRRRWGGEAAGETHALKILSKSASRAAGTIPEEVAIMRKFDQDNIMNVLEHYAPIPGMRVNHVIAMRAADLDLRAFIERSKGTSRLDARTSCNIVNQLAIALQTLSHHRVIHRDIKPGNILVFLTLSGLCVRLADFSRARVVGQPPQKKVRLLCKQESVPGDVMTKGQCTLQYCAPECFRKTSMSSPGDDTGFFTLAADVWSLGCVAFELFTFERFVGAASDAAECFAAIKDRVGPAPDTAMFACMPLRMSVSNPELAKLASYHVVGEEFATGTLRWRPCDRMSAAALTKLGQKMNSQLAGVVAPAASQELAEAAATSQEFAEASGTSQEHPIVAQEAAPAASQQMVSVDTLEPAAQSLVARLRSATVPCEKMSLSAVKCACSGHCYQPGHRYRKGCESVFLVDGARFCKDCKCSAVGCMSPRHHGPWCYKHRQPGWPFELQAVRAARLLAVEMMPCDIISFLEHVHGDSDNLLKVWLLANLKEPAACESWTRLRAETSSLHESLVRLAEDMDGSTSTALAEVARQGVMRFHGCSTVLRQLGIVQHASNAPRQRRTVRLGRTQSLYEVVHPPHRGAVAGLAKACELHSAAWRTALRETDVAKAIQAMLKIAYALYGHEGKIQVGAPVGKQKSKAKARTHCKLPPHRGGKDNPQAESSTSTTYAVPHVVRKMFLCYWQARGDGFEASAGAMRLDEFEGAFPDRGAFLNAFPVETTLAAASRLVFNRDDLGVFLSMHACLWHDVAKKWSDKEAQSKLLMAVETQEFHDNTVSLMRQMGHAVCPHSVVSSWQDCCERTRKCPRH